jgi:signal transduction histidine kinase
MAVSRFSRRILTLVALGVGVPALLLAVLGVFLTLRISREVARESLNYNDYIARQVAEAFERELMTHVRSAGGVAENVARESGSVEDILQALRGGTTEFQGEGFIPVEGLDGCSLLIVEGQPLLYAPGSGERRGQFFVGTLLRDRGGQFKGAGGWWVDPGRFIREHMIDVVQERLPGNPRMYGGLEMTRRLSVQLLGPGGIEIGRVRTPYTQRSAATVVMSGPFEQFQVRVSPTESGPIVWTDRFVTLEIAFILLMALAIVVASVLVLRYTIRQLELAQLKSGFVSNVSHELKTPIALIRLAVETLEMGRATTEAEREKFIATIGRETLRLQRLVENILDFARIEAGQKVLRFESVDIVALVRETLDSFRLRLEDQGFAVSTDLPDSLPRVQADPTALSHCLLNLLDNAIKYSRERREVRVSVALRGEYIAVAVTDKGIGIPLADQKRIFEKFVRVENGLVHDVKGAGLGLSLVDQIMRAHGGGVEVSSTTNEGSTFTLLIPVTPQVRAMETNERISGSLASIRGTTDDR